jgi:hypothetical protein
VVSLVVGACRGSPESTVRAESAAASSAPSSFELAPTERARLVTQMASVLSSSYVFPDTGAAMGKALREREASGAYAAVTTQRGLATVVTDDLRALSHDAHILLEYEAPGAPESEEDRQWGARQAENRRTAGFGATQWLAGNVALLALDSFESGDAVTAVAARRMSELADADALILDLRENTGGDPETVALIASYLFDATPVHLNDMVWRRGGTEASWTKKEVAGRRFGAAKPVFVLISHRTFSAAEELAYDLQALRRATIVGETSRGGAHPVWPHRLTPALSLRVPAGRARNPVTGSNWEGTGVVPDVAIAPADAPAEAYRRAAPHGTRRAPR